MSTYARIFPLRRQVIVAVTGSCRKGGRPGSATSRFQPLAHRKPVGSTRAIAETRSRLVDAIGSRVERSCSQHGKRVVSRELKLWERSGFSADPTGCALGEGRIEEQPSVGRVPSAGEPPARLG